MIELINGVSFLKDIMRKEQSLDMYNYLKENTNQRLYLIEGLNKYGISESDGSLIPFEDMPTSFKDNGFCINPFFVPYVENKPLVAPTINIDSVLIENSNDTPISLVKPTECLIQCEKCKQRVLDLEKELEDCNSECDKLELDYNAKCMDFDELWEKLSVLQVEKSQLLDKLSKVDTNDKINKNDVRGLCSALFELGFDINLQYVGHQE